MTRQLTLRVLSRMPIPNSVRDAWNALAERTQLRRIVTNIGWIFADRAIALVSSFAVGILVVRYLGPEDYGILSYARGFVALFLPLVALGLQDIVIRELVSGHEPAGEVLGTAFALQIPAAILTFVLVVGLALTTESNHLTRLLIVLSSLQLLLYPLEVVDYWFISQTQSKYRIWARNGVLVAGSLVRLGLILGNLSVLAFAGAALVETLSGYIVFLALARRRMPSLRSWRYSWRLAKDLMRDAWPLMLAAVAVTVYMRIDTVMIGKIAGAKELGLYSAAVRLSELWYFVPMAIATSVFPAIVRTRTSGDEVVFARRMQAFYDVMAGIAYIVALPMSILAPWLTAVLFGSEYMGADRVLSVHTWAFLFVTLGVARSRWLVAENLIRYSTLATVIGAIANLGLNILLIPRYGAFGAAWATLVAQAVSSYLSSLFWRPLRQSFKAMSRALAMPFRVGAVFSELKSLLLAVES